MQALPAAEIRERFLAFFEARGHKRLPSDSLIPANDPTLLFTGAGMNQFKDMFLGRGTLPYKRVVTTQKCLRVPDLDEVGKSPRHHTFFEMLGNFSFGDYFKEDCIVWQWEFFTQDLGMPKDQLVATVYEDDEEAYTIWRERIGLAPKKIYRFGEKENFWPAEAPSKGPNGPCGPCSEIYFDLRPGEPYPAQEGLTALPDDRFTEIGNCVFTQFDRQADGSLPGLPQKNIDVGLGLERIVAVLAGAPTNFDTDLFRPYLEYLQERTGIAYGENPRSDEQMRRISDHLRALTFCIADGAVPSNEGRGYVVRKILRRASRDGFELGLDGPFLHQMVDLVVEVMGAVFPEIQRNAGQCRSLIRSEEEGFALVYRQGLGRLEAFLDEQQPRPEGKALTQPVAGSGVFAFQLHDTHGFPVDITRQVMAERGLCLDEDGFAAEMAAQRERARAAAATADAVFAESAATALAGAGLPETVFCGYDQLAVEARVLALLGLGDSLCAEAGQGEELRMVVDRTPFYARGGGQVGDRGRVEGGGGGLGGGLGEGGGLLVEIGDTTAVGGYSLHHARVRRGKLEVGQSCQMQVDEAARRATERHHTATHLLHAALKAELGSHVNQAGSVVEPERLRFDFTHGEKLSVELIGRIEDAVNEVVLQALPVETRDRSMAEARAEGFVALFGEKYGEEVRTVRVGDGSKELCAGTHVASSGQIGAFRICSETAISAGTRRIEAVAGPKALALARADQQRLGGLARLLRTPAEELPEKVAALLAESKRLRKELEKALAADLSTLLREMEVATQGDEAGRSVLLRADGLSMQQLQELLGQAQRALAPVAAVLLSAGPDGVLVGACVSKDLTDRVRAGDLVKAMSQCLGGGGGGRAEMAQGKGKDKSKLAEAEALAEDWLKRAGLR